ncbi:DUF2304 domain-containing protein [Bacillaceae bacterium ZC4]|jgi:hypothetical protein|uniref:DUF2304 domain-containing protein n=1 Tax=Aeribacillus pallidus TaxID=33936 RepID=A0A223E4E5_9BACI|nr:DUF2304 domain-containing protein [Aeribacillus pallidus]ASS90106.1 hypothetical protein AP3564_07580 [Aeribacillus pallidus]AXI38998.1 DUF2304 domain-containing protein [Bacillaceae bacterium ZC4]MDR9791485.1 DUF2304 domain-containing protein [Aeribacillus pallidus]
MDIVQVIALIFALLFFMQVIFFTSRNKLQDKQAFLWIVFGIISLLIALFLPSINKFAHYIGISYMPALIFMVAFLVILNLLIYQTTVISSQQEKLKNVIQELAFLKKQIKDYIKDKEDKK